MANKRIKKYAELEALVLQQLRRRGPGWATSREIACEIGYAYPGVSRALLRLAAAMTIEVMETTWVSNKSRIRTCNVYRIVEIKATYPAWLLPPVLPIVASTGRVIRIED